MFNQSFYDTIPKFKDFNHWFLPSETDSGEFDMYDIIKHQFDGKYVYDLKLSDQRTDEISWAMFKQRPEYLLYHSQSLPEYIKDNQMLYESYLAGACFARYVDKNGLENLGVDSCWPNISRCLEWLRSTDFYTAPSSTRYHDSYQGGLCEHTLKVVQNIKALHSNKKWADWVDISSAVLVALVHDWCKINMYEEYEKNVKDQRTGQWNRVKAFKVCDNPMMNFGHGVSSMFLAQSFFQLSVEEALAIRWHMGEYNVADNEMNDLHRANENYPLVQLLQFADRLSITKY